MIAIDTNIAVYAHRGDVIDHKRAYEALNEALGGPEPVAFPWPVIHEFLAVVTSTRVFRPASGLDSALAQVRHWLNSPRAIVLHETPQHLRVLGEVCTAGRVTGGVIHDAWIAALCLQHGVRVLWSADRDMTRFPSLRVVNPLIARTD